MTQNKNLDYHRRQEKLEEYKLLPLAVFALVVMGFGFYLGTSEAIEIGEVKIHGFAKLIWALTVEMFYGFGILIGVGSLVFLIWLGMIAKEGGFGLHPWRPIAISGVLLLICFTLFLAGKSLENYVLANVSEINESFDIEEYKSYSTLAWFLWFLIAQFFAMFIAGTFFSLLRAPFNVKEHLDFLREAQENEK